MIRKCLILALSQPIERYKQLPMKHFLRYLFVIPTLIAGNLWAQDYQGFNNSNYAGTNALFFQPASIVDSRLAVDINLIGFDMNFQNNYVGLKWKDLAFRYDGTKDFQKTYLDTASNTNNKYVYLGMHVQPFSVSFNINRKNSLALFTRFRTDINVDDITAELARQSWDGLKYRPDWNKPFNNQGLSVQMMAWAEYGFTYGREIFSLDGGKHYLKAAVSFKVEQGLGSAYLYASDLGYNFKNNDTLSIYNSKVNYGHSTNFDFDAGNLKYKFIASPTVGFDMGIVYEWRPDIDKYTAEVGNDKVKGKPRRDKNKYKLKVGLSLLDIGNLKFVKGGISGDFTANMSEHNIHNFKPSNVKDFNDSVARLYTFSQDSGQVYHMNLPTSMSVQVDYNIWKGFYANFTAYGSFRQKHDVNKIHEQTTFSIAPRFEHKWFDFGLPFSVNTEKQIQLGAYMRLGVLVIGTNNWLPLLNDQVYGANVYAALKIPIPYGKPREPKEKKDNDRDGDGTPDRKDKCPDVAGPKENGGCPYADSDDDGIPDVSDSCPTIKGPVENHGCPWGDKDHDGVTDNIDKCPDVPGVKENNGCPWPDADSDGVFDKDDSCKYEKGDPLNHGCPWGDTDGDGVKDNVDKCITVAGPVENNGCPWPDTDGDGVLDKDDECPNTPGPKENKGCPVLKKKEKEVIRTAFTDLQFETGKTIIKSASFPSLNELAKLLRTKEGAKLIIAGHTDNVGTPESNMKLSQGRAEAVRNALIERGVDPSKFIVEHYGDTKPIGDNKTPDGRAKNRRVEMRITFE